MGSTGNEMHDILITTQNLYYKISQPEGSVFFFFTLIGWKYEKNQTSLTASRSDLHAECFRLQKIVGDEEQSTVRWAAE